MFDDLRMNVVRYLSFETGRRCPRAAEHPKCPIHHPERYRFSRNAQPLSEETIYSFWRWCRFERDFRGIVMWHLYNEPTLEQAKIQHLMGLMKRDDPGQPFQLFTADPTANTSAFDLVKVTDYTQGKELDDRILTITGEGKPYAAMQPAGWCGRGWGWEVVIDFYGNWLLCCNDFRCEEAVGNIQTDFWPTLLDAYHRKATHVRWHDQASYEALPRMCRACLDVNPHLHRSGATF